MDNQIPLIPNMLKLAPKICMYTYVFLVSLKLTVSLIMSLPPVGLAKRVGARLLLASTSEVYGGELGGFHGGRSPQPPGPFASCLRFRRNRH